MKETLYSRRSNLVVGFHGCDQSIKEQVFEHLISSNFPLSINPVE